MPFSHQIYLKITFQIFNQVKSEILNESIYCPAEKAVLLASFAAQAKHGDFGEGEVKDSKLLFINIAIICGESFFKVVKGYLVNERMLPAKILSQHTLSMEEWEDKV